MANLYWPRRSEFRSKERKQQRRERKWAEAEAGARDVLLFSHGHCLDGVTSAIVTLRALGADAVGVAYCQPSQMVDALQFAARFEPRGRKLMIADLSLQKRDYDDIVEACRALQQAGWQIEWRDHHHKQWEGLDLKPLRRHLDVLTVNDDATESGASLQQQALAPRDKFLERLANKVRDRDLWWNEDADSEILEYAITRMGTEAFTEHFLRAPKDGPIVDAVIAKAAQDQRRQQDQQGERILRGAKRYDSGSGCVGVVYGWLPKNVGLHQLLEDGCDVAINVRPNGKMSIRSRKGSDICHLIGGDFDGGGHPNASGADLGLSGLSYWWYVLRRGNVQRTREVAASAKKHLREMQ